ncbi:MAG: flagellar basal body-associated protein FliL [Desulfobacula sp.]|nr:flagellar basal body-associated protein FliL [Desulfobacula sp.]
MKKNTAYLTLGAIGIIFAVLLTGCGTEEQTQSEIAIGNWSQLRNRAYILLITNPKGGWNSSVRIADATSKIVESKGNAKGSWYIDKGQMIFTVAESDIQNIWEPNATLFFDIISLTETEMQLQDENGWVGIWKQTAAKKAAAAEEELQVVLPMGPVVVNLNKNRSNDKDRYLCLNLNLILKELMPEQLPPPIHPRAYDAAIIFLSSLVQNDVKDFDDLKKQGKKLVDVINPYIEGMVKDIEIEHVIVADSIDKVEEFIIEHTMVDEPVSGEDEETDTKKESDQVKSDQN